MKKFRLNNFVEDSKHLSIQIKEQSGDLTTSIEDMSRLDNFYQALTLWGNIQRPKIYILFFIFRYDGPASSKNYLSIMLARIRLVGVDPLFIY